MENTKRNKTVVITAVIGLLGLATIFIAAFKQTHADQEFPIIYTQFETGINGYGPMTGTIHSCNAKIPMEKLTFYAIVVNPPLTIMAHDLGGSDLKVYEGITTIYVTVRTPEEGRWLAVFDSKSPSMWQYLTAERACIDSPDSNRPPQEHIFLRNFGPVPLGK